MRKTLRLDLEPPHSGAPPMPSDAEVDAYYRTHCPPEGPPLDAIREHVVEALQAARHSEFASDTLGGQAAKLDLHLLVTQASDLASLKMAMPLDVFLSHNAARWSASNVGVEAIEAVISRIESGPHGARRRRLFAPDDVGADLLAALRSAADLIAAAARDGRRFRLTPAEQAVPLDEQVAVFASAGIRVRNGISLQALRRNATAEEIAREPWSCFLYDFMENSDDIDEFALKCIEGEDDREMYTSLAGAICALCKGRLPLEQFHSAVDFDAQRARVSFVLDGRAEVLELDASDAWVDMRFFKVLAQRLAQRSRHRLCSIAPDPRSEGIALACLSRNERLRLEAAGVPLDPM